MTQDQGATNGPQPETLDAAIHTCLRQKNARVQSFDFDGDVYWIKRTEHPSFRMRLQKGDPVLAFNKERAALKELSDLGLSVPTVVAEGDDYVVYKSGGSSLKNMLRRQSETLADRQEAFAAAGEMLALFHTKGVSHGRPALKDILWDGQRVTIIDFERYSPKRNTPQGHAMDVLIFVHSGILTGAGMTPEFQAAVEAFKRNDVKNVWADACKLSSRFNWMQWLLKPFQMREAARSRDWKAVPQTLAFFDAQK